MIMSKLSCVSRPGCRKVCHPTLAGLLGNPGPVGQEAGAMTRFEAVVDPVLTRPIAGATVAFIKRTGLLPRFDLPVLHREKMCPNSRSGRHLVDPGPKHEPTVQSCELPDVQ